MAREKMAGGDACSTKYIIQAAAKVLDLEEWLASGDLLEWRTVPEVAAGTGLSQNVAYRCLMTLKSRKRVEQGGKGWRISPEGIIRFAFLVHDYLAKQTERFTGRGG